MADAGDVFGLPEGMLSAGDPVEGNPFPETTRQHQVWSDATRRAEEERCRLNSRLLRERPAPEAENHADWMIALIVGKFDIWAKRGVHVVWSDTEVLADQWLFNYAQAWFEFARTAPILGHAESSLNELRLRLMERIEFWKAEGRRYVTDQEAFQKAKMEAVNAGWLRIQSKRLGGAKLSDCLKEAYDHHAGLFAKAGEPLTETVLNLTIPVLVFSGAIHHKWIPYPLIRPVGERVVDNFREDVHEHPHSDCELVPEQELTETFGGYKVTSGYESQFRRILESRIAHWRAEGLTRASVGDSQNSEPAGDIGQEAGNAAPPQPATVKDGTIGAEYRAESWQAIEISFLSDERVQIRCGPQIETRNYGELVGFADRRNGKPNQAWVMLRAMAEAKGLIRVPRRRAVIGRELKSGCRKYGRRFGNTSPSPPIPCHTSRAPDTRHVSRSAVVLRSTLSFVYGRLAVDAAGCGPSASGPGGSGSSLPLGGKPRELSPKCLFGRGPCPKK